MGRRAVARAPPIWVALGQLVVNRRAPLKSASSWDPNTQTGIGHHLIPQCFYCLHNISFASGTTVWTHWRVHPAQVTAVTETFEDSISVARPYWATLRRVI